MTLYRMNIGGPQAAGDEWSSGLHLTGALSVTDALDNCFSAAETAFSGSISTLWAPQTRLTLVKVTTIDPATGGALLVNSYSTAWIGSSAGAQPPPRDAVVVGLRSLVALPRGRGRMFLPAPAVDNLTTTGLLDLAAIAIIADAIKVMLRTLIDDGLTPVILGPVAGGSVTTPVTKVSIGRVLGTQRRRTGKIAQEYAIGDL
jgi:hypothetical protein